MEQANHTSATKGQRRTTKAGRKVRGVFFRDGEWWIRWACTLGHDHRKPSGELKTAATEEHKAKRAEVREARKAGRECCPRLVKRERPPLFEEILSDYMEHSRRTKRSTDDDKPKGASRRCCSLVICVKHRAKGKISSVVPCGEAEGKREGETRRRPATVNHYLVLRQFLTSARMAGSLTIVRAVCCTAKTAPSTAASPRKRKPGSWRSYPPASAPSSPWPFTPGCGAGNYGRSSGSMWTSRRGPFTFPRTRPGTGDGSR
jgi:hypothetical protein